MARYITTVAATLAIFGIAAATCQLSNQLNETILAPETKTELCESQGEGMWSLDLCHGHDNSFLIYDNACVPKDVYGPGNEGNDCGTPYTIEENFLPFVLPVKQVD
ncbi:hypothetical protein F4804DRAFT_336115 [Jackrogersella minutella]|nr:hypothetical protein F4804DRAFT_336115 [Jackrogersella minutella]